MRYIEFSDTLVMEHYLCHIMEEMARSDSGRVMVVCANLAL